MAWSFYSLAPIQEPTESYLIRTKGGLITQEILRDLGALCQEPGPKAKYKELVAETSAYLYCCPAVSPASIVAPVRTLTVGAWVARPDRQCCVCAATRRSQEGSMLAASPTAPRMSSLASFVCILPWFCLYPHHNSEHSSFH